MYENNGTLVYVESNYKKLTKSLQKIALFVLNSPGKVIGYTAAELSREIDVSEASVVRFCQTLGFKGFSDFKIKLAKDLGADNSEPVPSGVLRSDSTTDIISKVMMAEYDDIKFTLEMIDKLAMCRAVDMITMAKRIAFFGIGSSGIVAANAKEHFLHYGKPAHAESDSISQIILANTLGSNDIACAISISGQSTIPLQALKIAHENGAQTLCITQNAASAIAMTSDCVLVSYKRSVSTDDLGTMSRIVHSAIIDALAIAYAARNWDAAAKTTATNRKRYRIQQFTK